MSTAKRLSAAAIAIVALVLAAVSFGAGSASAYPAGTSAKIALGHSSGGVGDSVLVTGTNFTPGLTVSLSFHSTPVALGTVSVNASGHFSKAITVPNVALGAHLIVATDSAEEADADFTVTGSGAGGTGGSGGGGGLASTGVAVLGIASLGLVLLVGGGLMLLAGRRRKVVA